MEAEVQGIDSFCEQPAASAKSRPMTFVSLFSGCGGMDLGFIGDFDFLGKRYSKTGFVPVWANEISPAACRTYRQNIGDHILCMDIRDLTEDQVPNADVIIRTSASTER